MDAKKLFEEYLKLDDREKIKFQIKLNRERKENEKINQEKLQKLGTDLTKLLNENGEPYFSVEWVEKNILKK